MRRPGDQAKLLFLYLLRSSSALATETTNKAFQSARPLQLLDGHIHLRLARKTDVASIQRCNLATLPENYNSQFYVNHLRQWPDLALVAEHVGEDQEQQTSSASQNAIDAQPEPNIVAYVLGKVEPNQNNENRFSLSPNQNLGVQPRGAGRNNRRNPAYEELESYWQQRNEPEKLGHVTSLAVLQDYRRKGLAAALMDQLHCHLAQCYGSSAVGLHVRVTNKAATQLYQRDGYEVDRVIPHYYQDGEDAYFMKKRLLGVYPEVTPKRRWGLASRRPRPWESGPESLRLPRTVYDYDEELDNMSTAIQ
eukprot:CAMPEP_0195294722 /NCGR_PEP_ID=MMETSP0707-20130614/15767_1 /TAXON_ID=33640 /ORGANISM="Asterionellopsis glacialis, Strain CCMP134" /LENGTH=306 /DNA_ID=CAMNT_0040355769 /DNA_START=50 /DNA_END=970 /DNA_ORIENTATION=-